MKIVFIGGRDIHTTGGIENYVRNLASELVRLGHEPIVFCESQRNGEEMYCGFRVIHQKSPKSRFLCKPLLSLKAMWHTILHIKNVDIIHLNAWPPALWSPLGRLFGRACLLQGHGLEWCQSKYSPGQKKILQILEHYTAWATPNLIMCSDYQTQYFKKRYGYDAVTIPGAVILPDDEQPKSNVLERFGLQSKRYFLLLARLTEVKNPHYLISAFKKASHAGYSLVIAGDNNAQPDFVNSLHQLAAGRDDIVFTGAVFGADKEVLLRNAFAFCIPSTSEGLAITLMEAMSRKVPVIASDIPANRELLEKANALWVMPESEADLVKAIELAVDSPEALYGPVENNYQRIANEYTWPSVAKKYVEHIKTITKQ